MFGANHGLKRSRTFDLVVVAVAALTATLVAGCKFGSGSDKKTGYSSSGGGATSSVSVSLGSTPYTSTTSTSSVFVPSDLSEFSCYAINVLGPDIKDVGICSNQSRMGTAVGFFRPGEQIEIDVPLGTNRTFQVWGFANTADCGDVTSLVHNIGAGAGNNPPGWGSPGFLLAEKSVNVLSRKMVVDLTPAYVRGSTPTFCGQLPYPETTIDYATFVGGGTVTNGGMHNNTNDVCFSFSTTALSPVYRCYQDNVEVTCDQNACANHPDGTSSQYGVHRFIHTPGLEEGAHTFSVVVTDNAYNLTEPSPPSFAWTVDSTDPVVTVASISLGGASGGVYYTRASLPYFLLNLTEANPATLFSTITQINGAASGYSAFTCNTSSTTGTYSCALQTPVTVAPASPYTINFDATDSSGRTAATQTITLTVDRTPPVITIAPAGTTTSTDSWLIGGVFTDGAGANDVPAITITDAGGAVNNATSLCSVNSSAQSTCITGTNLDLSAAPFSVSTGGKHTLSIYTQDYATNATTTNFNLYVDTLTGQQVLGRVASDGSYATDERPETGATGVVRDNFPGDTGLNSPGQVALDTTYNRLFVADTSNNRVLVYRWSLINGKVASLRAIDVLGQPDFESYDTGTANITATSGLVYTPLNSPRGLALNSTGTILFVADSGNHRVLRFDITDADSNGVVDTKTAALVLGQASLAGNSLNVNGLASNAGGNTTQGLNAPYGLAYYATGDRLYVADRDNCRVAAWNNATGTVGVDISDGQNVDFHLGADNQAVGGAWTCTIAIGAAASNQNVLSTPEAVALDTSVSPATVYVADTGYNRVLQWTVNNASSENATGVGAGPGPIGQPDFATVTAGDSTSFAASMLESPRGVAVVQNTNGTTYVAVTMNYTGGSSSHRVKFFTTSNVYKAAWPAMSETSSGTTNSRLKSPGQLHFDPTWETLFVSDAGNHRISLFSIGASPQPSSGQAMYDVIGHTDFFGELRSFTAGEGNSPNEADLKQPSYVVADTTYNRLYVSDTGNHRVLVYSLDPETKKPLSPRAIAVIGVPSAAGETELAFLNATSSALTTANSTLSGPRGLALDSSGRLWVADCGNNRVLRFPTNSASISNSIVATVVLGQSNMVNNSSGATATTLSCPSGLSYDTANNRLFVADSLNDRIQVFENANTASNGAAAIDSGGGTSIGGTGAVSASTLDEPLDVVYTPGFGSIPQGIFVADASYHRVVFFQVAAPTVTPVAVGGAAIGCYGQHGVGAGASCTTGAANAGGTLAANGTFSLSSPAGVALNSSSQYLYVSDNGNNRVVAYDLTVAANQPGNAAFDNGNVNFHVMGGADQVSDYYTANTLVTAAPAALADPRGIFYLPVSGGTNLLYIVDLGWHRVGVYETP